MRTCMTLAALAAIPVAIWLYLLFGRGAFWRSSERDDDGEPVRPASWPRVGVVIPARNEAAGIAQSVGSLLRQDYPGDWSVILVDDNSSDGTADIARSAAAAAEPDRLHVLTGTPLVPGWTGKLW